MEDRLIVGATRMRCAVRHHGTNVGDTVAIMGDEGVASAIHPTGLHATCVELGDDVASSVGGIRARIAAIYRRA